MLSNRWIKKSERLCRYKGNAHIKFIGPWVFTLTKLIYFATIRIPISIVHIEFDWCEYTIIISEITSASIYEDFDFFYENGGQLQKNDIRTRSFKYEFAQSWTRHSSWTPAWIFATAEIFFAKDWNCWPQSIFYLQNWLSVYSGCLHSFVSRHLLRKSFYQFFVGRKPNEIYGAYSAVQVQVRHTWYTHKISVYV